MVTASSEETLVADTQGWTKGGDMEQYRDRTAYHYMGEHRRT